MAVISVILFTIVFCALTTWLSILYWKSPARRLKDVKGPKGLPIIGNGLSLIQTERKLYRLHNLIKNYLKMAKITIGPFRCLLIITDHDLIEFLLTNPKTISKGSDYKHAEPWLGTGLLTSSGTKWKKHRKIITPSFHFKILDQFLNVFESNGDILIHKMKSITEQSSINIYPFMAACSLDIICESVMGMSVNAQEDENSEYVQAVHNLSRIAIDRSFSPLKSFDLFFRFTEDYTINNKSLKIVHDVTNKMIKKKKVRLNQTQVKFENRNVEVKQKLALLDLLLQEQKTHGLTDDEIRQEIDTFLFAGHDTTSCTLSFIMYCLANNPEHQEQVYKEQLNIFGNEQDPNVTIQNLSEMKFLENFIKESLRLYPPVPFIGRCVQEDIMYKDMLLPQDLTTIILIYCVHTDPEYYSNPLQFDPSRFENVSAKHPFSFIPFSGGFRNCIGQKFAWLELKSVISKIIRNFKIHQTTPAHEVDLVTEIVLKSTNGVCIMLEKRIY